MLFASLYVPVPPVASTQDEPAQTEHRQTPPRLADVARTCSPRLHARSERLVVVDVDGLARLFGTPRAVAEQLRQAAMEGGFPLVHVAIAATQTAAMVLASMRAGITVIDAGDEAAALAPLPLRALEVMTHNGDVGRGSWGTGTANARGALSHVEGSVPRPMPRVPSPESQGAMSTLSRWGIRTLGQLAALPAVQVSERLGQAGVTWQRWARGEDLEPLVPTVDDEVFEGTFEPEWPIEAADGVAYVLDRLLEPLCQRLARRDRAAAILHLRLRLVTRAVHTRRLELPAPMRDPAVLRTLLMLALDADPAPAGIDIVTVIIDPTPGRVVQESLLTRALPPPEQVATLMARLSALMGDRRCGSPALIDGHRPGAFGMALFRMEQGQGARDKGQGGALVRPATSPRQLEPGPKARDHEPRAALVPCSLPLAPARELRAPSAALRRFRLPVPARVTVDRGRPIGVRTERQNLHGGMVRASAGPWRTSGEWWSAPATAPTELDVLRGRTGWNRDEWDVALNDGGVYRIFEDRDSGRWFVEGIVD